MTNSTMLPASDKSLFARGTSDYWVFWYSSGAGAELDTLVTEGGASVQSVVPASAHCSPFGSASPDAQIAGIVDSSTAASAGGPTLNSFLGNHILANGFFTLSGNAQLGWAWAFDVSGCPEGSQGPVLPFPNGPVLMFDVNATTRVETNAQSSPFSTCPAL
ncbi:MAG: hypothetical protein L3J91_04140 [Thermoplasmata archaeon]|nr:hypothetical protein [Thermoplasmata archaeon]